MLHRRARIGTETRNISVDLCNQWEYMSRGWTQINTDAREIYPGFSVNQ